MLRGMIAAGLALLTASAADATVRITIKAEGTYFQPNGAYWLLRRYSTFFVEDDQLGQTLPYSFGGRSGTMYLDDHSFALHFTKPTGPDYEFDSGATFAPLDLLHLKQHARPTIKTSFAVFKNWDYVAVGSVLDINIKRTKEAGRESFGYTLVPEPATWALTVGGFALIGGVVRTRRKQSVSIA